MTTVSMEAQPGDDTPVFSADVVIDEQVVDEQGGLVEARPQTRYRMTARRSARGLQTEIEYPEARLFARGPLIDPRGGHRIVIDGDLARGRIYDSSGTLVFGGEDDVAATGEAGGTGTSGLVLADRDVQARKRDLERTFGPARERIGGRDRYLSSDGDVLTETLVEPATMLPVEINVARGGALEQHTAIAYGRLSGGRWYVARIRSEVAMAGAAGRRFVSTRTHTNVASQEGR